MCPNHLSILVLVVSDICVFICKAVLTALFLNEQMLEILNNHRTNIPVSLHILGDFNYRAVDLKNRSNRLSGKTLSDCEGQLFLDIPNEHSAGQLVYRYSK